jgi:hypothetical protein
MHRRRGTRATALLLALLAGACTSIDAALPKLQAVKTAGVISAVGDEFTLTQAGLTGFENSAHAFPTEAWRLDDLIVSRVGALLSRRWQVQPVAYRRPAFAAAEPDTPPLYNTEMARLEGPSRMVDDSLQPAANDTLPSDRVKAAIIDLIERSLPATLQSLHLVD